MVRSARVANSEMPAYVVERLSQALDERGTALSGATVVVLGAAYRGGVKETAFSGVFATVTELSQRGAHVVVHDPMFSDEELRGFGWEPYHLGEPVEAAILQADHAEYRELSATDLPGAKAIFDGRGILTPSRFPAARYLRVGGGADSDATAAFANAKLATDA